MIYRNLPSPALRRAARGTIAVLPIAAVEQHGNHLPVDTDTAIADALGTRLESELPRLVTLLPTVWSGSSDHHRGFPGALSLGSETLVRVLCELSECLIETGFRRIFLLNCHGGNQTPMAEALYRLSLVKRKDEPPWIAAASYWTLAAAELGRERSMATPHLAHACEYETSIMLALDSRRVAVVKRPPVTRHVRSRFYNPVDPQSSRVVVCRSLDEITSTGALGSPHLASAAKGRRLLDLVSATLVSFIRDFARWKWSARR